MREDIFIKGAKEHNLKNIDVSIPRNKLVVLTGISGSGKSTLAFDTIFAEGQRRYVESLSSYARQFLGQMDKPDVEYIDGLSPAISIDQKTTSNNPRSTVGTVTEIYDYLRLLYARIGRAHCPECGKEITKQSVDTIIDSVMRLPEGSKIMVEAPVVRGRKGEYAKELASYRRSGYIRAKIDGQVTSLEDEIKLDKNIRHNISIVIDRLVIREGIEKRLSDSIETALKISEGLVNIDSEGKETLYSTNYACPDCGISIEEIEPRLFSFNSPFGACGVCHGLGFKSVIDEELVIGNPNRSINEGALSITGWNLDSGKISHMYFKALSKRYNFSLDTPVKYLPREIMNILLYGNGNEKIDMEYSSDNFSGSYKASFEGIINNLKRRYAETTSDFMKAEIERYMKIMPCESCGGKRLKREALAVTIDKKNIYEVCELSINKLVSFIEGLKNKLSNTEMLIADRIIKEILARLKFLKDVGLDYLTLSRGAGTLSGGEAQRIRLATQIGSGLTGVLYILDEPSIGLHQRDNDKLLLTLKRLRDLGNTVIVVEHDEDTMRAADHIIDVGPGAGILGGNVVAQGSVKDIENAPDSITGDYLSGRKFISVPETRKICGNRFIKIRGARQNNLKNIDVDIPIGLFTCVTGVSGSGKSSLINEILLPYLLRELNGSGVVQGNYDTIEAKGLDKVIAIDQSPIGRTPRSNPATYTGLFTPIRELFANTQDSKERGYRAGRFSFNVSGGRCEHCKGDGIIKIEMHFLPDVYVPCEVCRGKRYNRETLSVKYKGKNIYDVLEMTIDEACGFFENIPSIYNKIKTLEEVGLGYIKLGQPAPTLSGGEAQRVKLSAELSKRSTGRTVYILDEPTTGLHIADVDKLITILKKLSDSGNTVIVIEHNLDVIKVADYIIDLGPEGGDNGGALIAAGSPEEVAQNEKSYTGQYLRKKLSGN
jgi:excinuclease ABC subunit A